MSDTNKQDTLYDRIYTGRGMTDEEVEAAVRIFGHGCRLRNKARLYWAFHACPNIKPEGIFRRVFFGDNGQIVSYCAGQSYPDEIRTVRECLIGR